MRSTTAPVLDGALDAAPGKDGGVGRRLGRRAGVETAPGADVLALGVLPHDQHREAAVGIVGLRYGPHRAEPQGRRSNSSSNPQAADAARSTRSACGTTSTPTP